MNYEYIKFGDDSFSESVLKSHRLSGAGLQDRYGVVKKVILYGFLLNMTPIIPYVVLNGKHQIHKKNKISNLSEYYDYSKLKIGGNKFNVVTNMSKIDKRRVLNLNYFQGHNALGFDHKIQGIYRKNQRGIIDDFHKLDFFLPFNKSVISDAQKIISKYFSNSYTSIQIRRGDKLMSPRNQIRYDLSKDRYDKMTRVDNIKKILRKKNLKGDVFVMSDMTEDDNAYSEYKKKCEEFNFIFANEVPELNQIKQLDNYLLWVMERVIARSKICKQQITMDIIKDDFIDLSADKI